MNHTESFISVLQNITFAIVGILNSISIICVLIIQKSLLSIYIIFFIGLFYLLNTFLVSKKLSSFSQEVAFGRNNLTGISKEGLKIQKELFISKRQYFVLNKIKKTQLKLFNNIANATFLISFPKFSVEAFLFIFVSIFVLNQSLDNILIKQLPILILAGLRIILVFNQSYAAQSTMSVFSDSINLVYRAFIENNILKTPKK